MGPHCGWREGCKEILNVKTISLMQSLGVLTHGIETMHGSSETLVPRTLCTGLEWRKNRAGKTCCVFLIVGRG